MESGPDLNSLVYISLKLRNLDSDGFETHENSTQNDYLDIYIHTGLELTGKLGLDKQTWNSSMWTEYLKPC